MKNVNSRLHGEEMGAGFEERGVFGGGKGEYRLAASERGAGDGPGLAVRRRVGNPEHADKRGDEMVAAQGLGGVGPAGFFGEGGEEQQPAVVQRGLFGGGEARAGEPLGRA